MVKEDSKSSHFYPSPLMIKETKYSSLWTLLLVTVYCLKFIYIRLIQKCSSETKVNFFGKHKLLEHVFGSRFYVFQRNLRCHSTVYFCYSTQKIF